MWDQISQDAQAELAALSTSDREKLAQLIEANSEWIDRLDNAILRRSIYSMNNRSTASECRSLIDEGRIELAEGRTFAAAATSIKAYWCSLTFNERQYEDVDNDFERGAMLASDVEFTAGLDILNTLANLVFRKMDAVTKELQGSISSNGIADEIIDAERSANALSFRNGEPESLFVKIRFRCINQNDTNAEGELGKAATFFDQIIDSYTQILNNVSQPLIWRPGFTQTSAVKDFNQFLTVPSESVTNSDVILINTQYRDDVWEVAFGNDGTEEEPSFNFNLIYDDGYVKLEKSISAIISNRCPFVIDYGTFTDPRDGYIYKTVNINGQIWFAENLRYAGNGAGTTEFYSEEEIDLYGRRYYFSEVEETTQTTSTVCPQGWHVPTNQEWTMLEENANIPYSELGNVFKDCEQWNGTNLLGLSLLPGGKGGGGGTSTGNIGRGGSFWTSSSAWSSSSDSRAYSRGVWCCNNELSVERSLTYSSLCVRCLKD